MDKTTTLLESPCECGIVPAGSIDHKVNYMLLKVKIITNLLDIPS